MNGISKQWGRRLLRFARKRDQNILLLLSLSLSTFNACQYRLRTQKCECDPSKWNQIKSALKHFA